MAQSNITIKSLSVRNFKGIKSLNIDFKQNETFIRGCNGSGKTTLFDSFTWALFGKDSLGNSDSKFNIKTLDDQNKVIPRIDHIVEVILDIDGREVSLKRVFKEKWVKKRGTVEAEFDGNRTEFFWNDVPKSQREYQDKINGIMDESVFKLLSNPLAFNQLHWEKQRNLLITITGEINEAELAKGNVSFTKLLAKLSEKSLSEYKKELAAKRKRLKDAISDIPARIDEVNQGKPEAKDFDTLKQELGKEEVSLTLVQNQIDDLNKAAERSETEKKNLRDEMFDLLTKNGKIRLATKEKVESQMVDPYKIEKSLHNELKEALQNLKILNAEKENIDFSLKKNISDCESIDSQLAELRTTFEIENKKELIIGDDFNCPTCNRKLETEDIESKKNQMRSEFNESKSKSLESINNEGVQLKERLEAKQKEGKELENHVNNKKRDLADAEKKIEQLKNDYEVEKAKPKNQQSVEDQIQNSLDFNAEYQEQVKRIKSLELQIEEFKAPDNHELILKKNELTKKIDELKEQIGEEQLIINADKRIQELSESEKSYSQQIADIERDEFTAQEFTIAKVTALEDRVNNLFGNGIRFKMFDIQVNGQEIPTCQLLYKGVPWNDINFAAKVNTGIGVINVLSTYFGITCPIWIDGRESVTSLIKTHSQLINLIVSEEHKSLTVS
ncbi:MAG: hypothetical protein AB3N18_11140 [Allomuricauda sp.]